MFSYRNGIKLWLLVSLEIGLRNNDRSTFIYFVISYNKIVAVTINKNNSGMTANLLLVNNLYHFRRER